MHILLWSITKHGPPQAILVSDWPIFKNFLLWNRLAKLTETWQEASMECPLWRLLISSWSVNKHGHHRQFLFLISKKSSPLKLPSQMNWNLVGSIYMYGRLCIKFPQSRMKGERHRLSPLPLVLLAIVLSVLFQFTTFGIYNSMQVTCSVYWRCKHCFLAHLAIGHVSFCHG